MVDSMLDSNSCLLMQLNHEGLFYLQEHSPVLSFPPPTLAGQNGQYCWKGKVSLCKLLMLE